MNLVEDPWLPFKLKDGTEKVLPITAIMRSDVVDFALPRADFQGAAYQFAIGLLQTVFAPQDLFQWHDFYEQPPQESRLQAAFDRVAHAFNFTGDGPLFMQDFDDLADIKPTPVSGLLIEAPGHNTLTLNTDHFVKRDIGSVMSLETAAIALYTLQINAPGGGKGHRTGLRGGGPLTAIVLPQSLDASLWQKLWLNVINREFWHYDDPDLMSHQVFPWLASTQTSEPSQKKPDVYAGDVHPLQMYFPMPRRIRCAIEHKNIVCAITGKSSAFAVSDYRTKSYGINYSGAWQHPLTAYKWNPKKPNEVPLSIKGQPGGISYKIWDVLSFTSKEIGQSCPLVVSHFYNICHEFTDTQCAVPRLWVFGYDMKQMKARGWYSSTLPLFYCAQADQEDILYGVKALLKLSTDALQNCQNQMKSAWFDRPEDIKNDMPYIDQVFWQRTETLFFNGVQQIIDNAKQGYCDLQSVQAKVWLNQIQRITLDIFDEYALSELGSGRSMAKRIQARQHLTAWLYGGKDIKRFKKDYQIDTNKETA